MCRAPWERDVMELSGGGQGRRTSLWSLAGGAPSRPTELGSDASEVRPFRAGSPAAGLKWNAKERRAVLAITLKCADVSHATRPWLIHERWSSLVLLEFCAQVRREIAREVWCCSVSRKQA